MSAEITLFAGIRGHDQVPSRPIGSAVGTFTPSQSCIARVFANGTNITLSTSAAVGSGTVTWTVPANNVEYFGCLADVTVTVVVL